jgi:hypothetical protein
MLFLQIHPIGIDSLGLELYSKLDIHIYSSKAYQLADRTYAQSLQQNSQVSGKP